MSRPAAEVLTSDGWEDFFWSEDDGWWYEEFWTPPQFNDFIDYNYDYGYTP